MEARFEGLLLQIHVPGVQYEQKLRWSAVPPHLLSATATKARMCSALELTSSPAMADPSVVRALLDWVTRQAGNVNKVPLPGVTKHESSNFGSLERDAILILRRLLEVRPTLMFPRPRPRPTLTLAPNDPAHAPAPHQAIGTPTTTTGP